MCVRVQKIARPTGRPIDRVWEYVNSSFSRTRNECILITCITTERVPRATVWVFGFRGSHPTALECLPGATQWPATNITRSYLPVPVHTSISHSHNATASRQWRQTGGTDDDHTGRPNGPRFPTPNMTNMLLMRVAPHIVDHSISHRSHRSNGCIIFFFVWFV